jgi:hypothetical protein
MAMQAQRRIDIQRAGSTAGRAAAAPRLWLRSGRPTMPMRSQA